MIEECFVAVSYTHLDVYKRQILNIESGYNLLETIINGTGGALGFTLAIVLFAGVRERLELSSISDVLKGFPIALITAGLMSIAFLGFQGLL